MYMIFLYFSLCTMGAEYLPDEEVLSGHEKSRAMREDDCQGVVRWTSIDSNRESENKVVFR